ncbi:MAG: hypothetical protein ACJAS4_001481 [Bacteriovoracaceae bacterium]|jgi:hypothetical protein
MNKMSNFLSEIYDLIAVSLLGGAIFLFAGEVKLEALKRASQGTAKLSSFTERMTGQTLDLSDERVYGKNSKKKGRYDKTK